MQIMLAKSEEIKARVSKANQDNQEFLQAFAANKASHKSKESSKYLPINFHGLAKNSESESFENSSVLLRKLQKIIDDG